MSANHPPLQFTHRRNPNAHPPIIMGPTAPVDTDAPCSKLTETIDVLKIAGKPEKAPANKPRPLELSQLLTKIQNMAAKPRRRWMYHFTLFVPFGVGGRLQHSMNPTTMQMSIMTSENSQIWTPMPLTTVSSQVTKKAARNQITREISRVINVTAVLLKRFSSFEGRIFHTGKKNKFVARIPIAHPFR